MNRLYKRFQKERKERAPAETQRWRAKKTTGVEANERSPTNANSSSRSNGTESIAVGSHAFVKEIKNKLAVKTVGRKMRDIIDGFELREPEFSYTALFEAKKEDIGYNRGLN